MDMRKSILSLLILLSILFSVGCSSVNIEPKTCKKCGSTVEVITYRRFGFVQKVEWKMTYAAPGSSTCSHQWEAGVSRGIDQFIPDGTVVLVRKAGNFGAFIPYNQQMHPEQLSYQWYYRLDGKGRFDSIGTMTGVDSTGDTSFKIPLTHGGFGNPFGNIKFGPFEVEWSGMSQGEGHIYYPHLPGEQILPQDIKICITQETSIVNLDASDPKWKYKASIGDTSP